MLLRFRLLHFDSVTDFDTVDVGKRVSPSVGWSTA